MYSLLWLFLNWKVLVAIFGAALAAAGVYFVKGPKRLMEIVLDARTWVIVGGILLYLTLLNSAETIREQTLQIETQKIAETAGEDSEAVVENVRKEEEERQVQEEREQAAIDNAEPGDELDALLDEIYREHDLSH